MFSFEAIILKRTIVELFTNDLMVTFKLKSNGRFKYIQDCVIRPNCQSKSVFRTADLFAINSSYLIEILDKL